MPNPAAVKRVVEVCETQWDANKDDCSAFARSVAAAFDVPLAGNADDIARAIAGPGWRQARDGAEAAQRAAEGSLVIAALPSSAHQGGRAHGHVAVVVDGPVNDGKYPSAYWGSLGGSGRKKATVNWAWRREDRDKVAYAWRPLRFLWLKDLMHRFQKRA